MAVGRRLFLALAGVAGLCFYALVAVLGYRVLTALWAARPNPLTVAVVVVATGLTLGYLSYRSGTTQLRRRLGAVPLPAEIAPGVHHRLTTVADRMALDRPELLLAGMDMPNALAIAGNGGAVVLDRRLLELLSPTELEALFAHELAHLETNDALLQTVGYSLVQTVAGLVAMVVVPVALLLGGFARAFAFIRGRPESAGQSLLGRAQRFALFVVVGLGVVVAMLAMGYSRRREFAADARAAEVADPLALARALVKIERASTPAFGLLTPLYVHGDEDGPLARLLSTHPPLDARIERLEAIADRHHTQRGGRH